MGDFWLKAQNKGKTFEKAAATPVETLRVTPGKCQSKLYANVEITQRT
jgi:hypothetical protein